MQIHKLGLYFGFVVVSMCACTFDYGDESGQGLLDDIGGGVLDNSGISGGGSVNETLPSCLIKPSQVIALGDSYVSQPVLLVPKIVDLAIAEGSLRFGQSYRDYSIPGTVMGSPRSPGNIPPQLDLAIAEDSDIKVIIMDGGGNDIIGSVVCLGDGTDRNPTCTDIVRGNIEEAKAMADKAKSVGVEDVIFFL